MDERARGLTGRAFSRRLLLTVVAGAAALLIALAGVVIVHAGYGRTYLFPFLPGVLLVGYFGGRGAGIVAAAGSTVLAYVLLEPSGLSAAKLVVEAPLLALFLLSALAMAEAGVASGRYALRLRRDLSLSRVREAHDAFVIRATELLAKRQEQERPDEILCAAMAAHFGGPCALFLRALGGDALLLRALAAADDPDPERLRLTLERVVQSADDPLVGYLLAQEQPLVLDDDALQRTFLPTGLRGWLTDRGYAALLLTPLRAGGERLGCLLVLGRETPAWSADALRAAETVGERVALALYRDRLAADAVRLRDEHLTALWQYQEQLRVALEAGQMGTWDWDITAEAVEWSPTLESIHGLDPGTFPGTFAAFQEEIFPEDRESVLGAITATVERDAPYEVEYRIRHPDGALRWLAARGRLVRDAAGRPARMVGVCMDVTARRRAEEAQRFLAEASRELSRRLNYEGTLARITRLVVPTLADWCIVDLLADDGSLRMVAVAHTDHEKEQTIRELRDHYPPSLSASHAIMRVLRTGTAEIQAEVTDAELAARAADGEHLRLLREAGITSHVVAPLRARGRVLGVVSLVYGSSGRRYAPDDLPIAEELARRAALAIDNARLFEAERAARAEAEAVVGRLHTVNRLISITASALDLNDVFDEFGDALQSLVPFLRLTISLYVPECDWLTMPYFKGPRRSAPPQRFEGPKAGTVRGWVIDHGRAFIRPDTRETREFTEDEVLAAAGVRSYLVVPLAVGGGVIGTLNFGHDRPAFYTEAHARTVQPIADQLALTVSRFRLFDQTQRRAGELSATLQRALLPTQLPEPPFATIGAIYRPADPEANLGGDWYDAFELPDDRLLLSIGDVTGHGLAAAALMGQARHVARAYALEGRAPAQILTAMNAYLTRLPDAPQLSIWIATLDPVSGELVYGSAGHPSALTLGGDDVGFLPARGPALGVLPEYAYGDARVTLPPDTRLILYTDGLVEATRDIAEGERRLLAAAVGVRPLPPAGAAEALVDQVLEGAQPRDDIAVLVADILPVRAPLAFSVPATADSLRRVRRAVRIYADRLGVGLSRRDEIVTAVGEAALNVVEHAYRGTPGLITVEGFRREDVFLIRIRDTGQWQERARPAGGRGIRIMEGFADEVRLRTDDAGTVVELLWRLHQPSLAIP